MTRRIEGIGFLTVLAVQTMMMAGGIEARAASVGVSGTVVPLPGDSPFLYEFEFVLTSGSIAPGSTVTVGLNSNGLVGITALSGTQQPPTTGNGSESWGVPPGGIVTTPTGNPPPYDQQSSVTWEYLSGPTISTVGANLGLFTVETTQSYPDNAPPATNGITQIDFGYSIVPVIGDSPSTGGGHFILSSVPEPSAAILLLIGGAALALPVRLCRRPTRSA
jgi:hypothetical protein